MNSARRRFTGLCVAAGVASGLLAGCVLEGRTAPRHEALLANAGIDQKVLDEAGVGVVRIVLDGSGSLGAITSYAWSESGHAMAGGMRPVIELPIGIYTITLTVTDRDGATKTDQVEIEARIPTFTLPEGFEDTLVVSGLSLPTRMTFLPDGRLLVAEQGGQLRVVKHGELLPQPMLTVSVIDDNKRGLVGVAVDPQFDTNGYVYVYYTEGDETHMRNRLSRFTVSADRPDVADPGSERIMLDDIPAAASHNAGSMEFGPDGYLYVGVGDAGHRDESLQLGSLRGKLLRLAPAAYPDVIPPDNPFVGRPGARGEIWALGFRNPYMFAIDAVAGTLQVNDVGRKTWEEINLVTKGGNYGWDACEGPCGNPAFQDPLYAYDH